MQIINSSEIKNHYLNVLVYGESGVGKTTFCGTAIKCFNPIFLSAEAGLLSLRNLGHYDFVKIEKFDDLVEVHNWLHLSDEAKKYDTVIIDSLTEIQQSCMDYLVEKRLEEKKESPSTSSTHELGDFNQPKIQDWGALNSVMSKTIKHFRDMDRNLIVTALSESRTNEETMETKIQPLLQGKLKDNIAAYFDEVLYQFTVDKKVGESKETKHVCSTKNNGKWLAKDRSGVLAPLVKPDFCEIYNTINNTNRKEDKNANT